MLSPPDFGGFRPSTPCFGDLFRASMEKAWIGRHSADIPRINQMEISSRLDYKLRNWIPSQSKVSNGFWSGNPRLTRNFSLANEVFFLISRKIFWKNVAGDGNSFKLETKPTTTYLAHITAKLPAKHSCCLSNSQLISKLFLHLKTKVPLNEDFCFGKTSEFPPQIEYPMVTLCRKHFHPHKPSWIPEAPLRRESFKVYLLAIGIRSTSFLTLTGMLLDSYLTGNPWHSSTLLRTTCRGRLSRVGTVFYWLLMNESGTRPSDCLKVSMMGIWPLEIPNPIELLF